MTQQGGLSKDLGMMAILEHPYLSTGIIFAISGILVFQVDKQNSIDHFEFFMTLGALIIATVAITITAYIFMYQTDQKIKQNPNVNPKAIACFERDIKTILVLVVAITTIVTATTMVPFLFWEGVYSNLFRVVRDTLMSALIAVLLANLFAIYSIIRSSNMIVNYALSEKHGAMNEYSHLDVSVFDNDPMLHILSYDATVGNIGKEREPSPSGYSLDDKTENVSSTYLDAVRSIEPFETLVSKVLEKDAYFGFSTMSMCQAFSTGHDCIVCRLRDYLHENDIDPRLNDFIAEYLLISDGKPSSPEVYMSLKKLIERSTLCFGDVLEADTGKTFEGVQNLYRTIHCPQPEPSSDGIHTYDTSETISCPFSERAQDATHLELMERVWALDYIMVDYLIISYLLDKDGDGPLKGFFEFFKRSLATSSFLKTAIYFDEQTLGNDLERMPLLKYNFFQSLLKKLMFDKSLGGLDLSGTNLSNTSFFGSDLTGCDFSYSKLSGSDFTNSNLSDCKWIGVDIEPAGCIFKFAEFTNSVFGSLFIDHRSSFLDTVFENSSIYQATFDLTEMRECHLINMNMGQCLMKSTMMDTSFIKETLIDKSFFTWHDDGMIVISITCPHEDSPMEPADSLRISHKRNGVETVKYVANVKCQISKYILEKECIYVEFPNVPFTDVVFDPELLCGSYALYAEIVSGQLRLVYEDSPENADDNEEYCVDVSREDGGCIGCDLEGTKFEKSNITNSRFIGCNLRNNIFFDVGFMGSFFYETWFTESFFERADLGNTITVPGGYIKCNFNDCSFKNSIIANDIFQNCSFNGCKFEDTTISGVTLDSSSLSEAIFINCDIKEVRVKRLRHLPKSKKSLDIGSDGAVCSIVLKDCRIMGSSFEDSEGYRITMQNCTIDGDEISMKTMTSCKSDE